MVEIVTAIITIATLGSTLFASVPLIAGEGVVAIAEGVAAGAAEATTENGVEAGVELGVEAGLEAIAQAVEAPIAAGAAEMLGEASDVILSAEQAMFDGFSMVSILHEYSCSVKAYRVRVSM